jgi:hypothetical protein
MKGGGAPGECRGEAREGWRRLLLEEAWGMPAKGGGDYSWRESGEAHERLRQCCRQLFLESLAAFAKGGGDSWEKPGGSLRSGANWPQSGAKWREVARTAGEVARTGRKVARSGCEACEVARTGREVAAETTPGEHLRKLAKGCGDYSRERAWGKLGEAAAKVRRRLLGESLAEKFWSICQKIRESDRHIL